MEFFHENIHLGEVIVQLLAFLIVFFFLKKFAWKPILNVINARRERFQHEWTDIEKMKSDLAKVEKDYKDRLKTIEDEARSKMQEAIQDGRRIAREIQEQGRAESQASIEKARADIDLEIEKARLEFRREVAKLSLQVAEKVIHEKMDAALQEKKALEIITELEKTL